MTLEEKGAIMVQKFFVKVDGDIQFFNVKHAEDVATALKVVLDVKSIHNTVKVTVVDEDGNPASSAPGKAAHRGMQKAVAEAGNIIKQFKNATGQDVEPVIVLDEETGHMVVDYKGMNALVDTEHQAAFQEAVQTVLMQGAFRGMKRS